MSEADPFPPYRPRCIHLTCKSMMVYGEAFERLLNDVPPFVETCH